MAAVERRRGKGGSKPRDEVAKCNGQEGRIKNELLILALPKAYPPFHSLLYQHTND